MNRFEWTSPQTLAQAFEMRTTTTAASMLSAGGQPPTGVAILKAGGIDLLGLMKDGLLTPARIVNLRTLPELGTVTEQRDGTVRVGANVSLAQVASDPVVRTRYRALADAAGTSASPQLRQVATLGGNLLQRPRCWYFRSAHHHCVRKGGATCFAFAGENQYHAIFGQDGCAMVHPSTAATALAALGAKVELASAGGTRRIVALEAFLLPPAMNVRRENDLRNGEILTAILLPAIGPRVRSLHLRQGELESFDWPIADVAVVLDLEPDGACRSASVVLGAAAPVPYRATKAETVLTGSRVSDETAQRAARAAMTGAAPLSGNGYKVPIFETLVRRAIINAASPS
jgi:xanthine dehydrogenase YagS FAD-binding subunit